jgi:hypothetical protein
VSPIWIRLWFCLAVSTIAAAVADPLLEFASNAGFFGPGAFTDRSNADVLPALLVGCAFLIFCALLSARTDLIHASNRALRPGIATLLPCAFLIQIAVLYAMETSEQLVVYGHVLGPAIWLGAPPAVSVLAHAFTCALVGFLLARAVRSLARSALSLLRFVRTLVARTYAPQPATRLPLRAGPVYSLALVSGAVRERAPPLLTVS